MNKITHIILFSLGLVLLVSCSSTDPQKDIVAENQKKLTSQVKDLADEVVRLGSLQDDITQLKFQITVLDTQLVRYEEKIAEYEKKAELESQKSNVSEPKEKDPEIINLRGNIYVLSRETEALKETVNSLVESKDSLQAKVSTINASLAKNKQSPVMAKRDDEMTPPARFEAIKTQKQTTKTTDELPILTISDYRQRYSSALTLYFQNNFNPAILEFQKLIAHDPKGEFADNSQYWIGECYYSMEMYDKAIQAFEKCLLLRKIIKVIMLCLKLPCPII